MSNFTFDLGSVLVPTVQLPKAPSAQLSVIAQATERFAKVAAGGESAAALKALYVEAQEVMGRNPNDRVTMAEVDAMNEARTAALLEIARQQHREAGSAVPDDAALRKKLAEALQAASRVSTAWMTNGAPVKITRLGSTGGILVKPEYLAARELGEGTLKGWIPGHGGDVWWIEHANGSIGAYSIDEFGPKERPKAPASEVWIG